MSPVVSEQDLAILVQAGLQEADIRHSILVARKAVEIAERTGKDLDLQLVARGGLFHDLGKALTHSFQHGELGAEIGRSFGLPKSITDIARKHFHGGLSPKEARDLDLPAVDYTPRLLEERIILYADRLVDILTEGYFTFHDEREAEEQFEEIVTTHRAYGKDKLTSARYVGYHREISGYIKQTGADSEDT
ncbi:MAG TPA: HDIG domain-containing protein [Candidatus Methanoperedens sp.]|nr:HDIG domain-containing protein [Candidatus Methanoperedens sp.]